MKRFFLVLTALLLSACSPTIPLTLDLTGYLPAELRAGALPVTLPGGGGVPLSLALPSPEGSLVDLSGLEIPGQLEAAALEAWVALNLEGDLAASGPLSVTFFLAPEGANLWEEGYALPPVVIPPEELGASHTVAADLNPAQLAGLNARRFRVGVRLEGALQGQGAGTLSWALDAVVLRAAYRPF